ncbi:hypothetical protein [Halorarius litoreus]|nr:hypothetical protein [Halorarius litoreus]
MRDHLDFIGQVDTSGSAERARETAVEIGPVEPTGPFIVAFEDGGP